MYFSFRGYIPTFGLTDPVLWRANKIFIPLDNIPNGDLMIVKA
jgi:hypothetical protein